MNHYYWKVIIKNDKSTVKIDGKLIVLLDIIGLFEDVEQDSEELLTDQYENQDSANNKTTKNEFADLQ